MLPLVSSPKQAAPKLAASLFPTTTPSMGLRLLLLSALCGLSAGRVLLGGRNDSTLVYLGAPPHLGDARLRLAEPCFRRRLRTVPAARA
jgi:hypothetical protein